MRTVRIGRGPAGDLTDLSKETSSIHALYGTKPGKASFANNCLLARRLVERGVRFIQLYHRGWDTHGASFGEDIVEKLAHLCRQTDKAIYGLLTDLKQFAATLSSFQQKDWTSA